MDKWYDILNPHPIGQGRVARDPTRATWLARDPLFGPSPPNRLPPGPTSYSRDIKSKW